VGFETIWGIIEALYGKNIFEIAIWPPNCESWVSPLLSEQRPQIQL